MLVDLDSFKEWVQDGRRGLDRTDNANKRYSAVERRQIRILAPPYGRSGRVTLIGGLYPGDTADMVRLGWYFEAPTVTVTGNTNPNGALPTLMEMPQSGTKSMMNPGLHFYFESGPAPTTISSESEARGVDIDTLRVNFSSTIGNSTPTLFQPEERALIMLNSGGTVVNFRLPARTNSEGVTVNAWLDSPTNPNAAKFSVWMRCGSLPNAGNYERRAYFGISLPVHLRSVGNCTGERFVSVASEPGAPAVVIHLTAQAHRKNQVTNDSEHLVGIPFNPTSSEFDGIVYGFKSAAWRLYGATEGTRIVSSFRFYKNNACTCNASGPIPISDCRICLDTTCDRSHKDNFTGRVYLCVDETAALRTNDRAIIDSSAGPARVLTHELGHSLLNLPDEYVDASGCITSTGLCGHSIMELQYTNINGLCNSTNHRSTPEFTAISKPFIDRIRGPNGVACGPTSVSADATSAWARWSPSTPHNGAIPLLQQNVEYVRQGFTAGNQLGAAIVN